MMNNLFSVFDPSTFIFNSSLNWSSLILPFLFTPTSLWLIYSPMNFCWFNLTIMMNKEIKTLIGTKIINLGNTMIIITLFLFIFINNSLGLFPYIFTSTSHMVTTMALSTPFWVSFMFYGWINNNTHMFSHLSPQGTPPTLMPFMVCIELISNMIRPLTLAIRLSANMIAGHLLLTLLSNTTSKSSNWMILILVYTQMLLLILETAVALIQSYVFSILTTLYSTEVN